MKTTHSNNALRVVEEQVFSVRASQSFRSMMLSAEALLLSAHNVEPPDDFRSRFAGAGPTIISGVLRIPYEEIRAFKREHSQNVIRLQYTGIKPGAPGEIQFLNGEADVRSALLYLEKVQGYRRQEASMGRFRAIRSHLGYTAFCLLLTFALYDSSLGHESNSAIGMRRAVYRLFDRFAMAIGPTGSLLLGFSLTALALWFLWKRWKSMPVETRLERS